MTGLGCLLGYDLVGHDLVGGLHTAPRISSTYAPIPTLPPPTQLLMKGSLLQILQSFRSRPIKKLTPAAIADVYARFMRESDLADLISSGYFESVLWRFFHADASNSHLELLLLACAYDLETRLMPVAWGVRRSPSCMDMMLLTPEKLHPLLVRVLQSTMVFRETDSKLQVAAFSFLRALVLRSTVLSDCSLYAKWRSALSEYLQDKLDISETPAPEMRSIIHSFLSFVLVCRRLENELGMFFKDVWVHFVGDSFDFKTNRLAQLLLNLRLRLDYHRFVGAVRCLHLVQKIPLAKEALPYDFTAAALRQELELLAGSELKALADKLACALNVPESLLPQALAHLVVGSNLSPERLASPLQFNEEDIFDLFESCNKSIFCPDDSRYIGPFEANQWTECLRHQYAQQTLQQFNARCLSVFSRLKIEDPALENGIVGSSKYFSLVSNLSVNGSLARISTKQNLAFENGQLCLLIELMKPNKFEATNRMVHFGLNACHVMRVVSSSAHGLTVQWNAPGYEDRFNAIMLLPKTICPAGPRRNFPIKLLNGSRDSEPEPEPKRRKVAMSEKKVDAKGDDSADDSRKVDDSGKAGDSKIVGASTKLGDSKNVGPHADYTPICKTSSGPVSGDLAKAVASPMCCIEAPGFEYQAINRVLDSLKETTCLVVLPTQAAVDLFPCREKCFRSDSIDEDVLMMRQKQEGLLRQVQSLSERLGLGEYAFETCVQNALKLYEGHIEPKWQSFLRHLSPSTYGQYPFRDLSDICEEELPEAIIQDYTNIRQTFASLQELMVMDLAKDDVLQLRGYLLKTADCVVVAEHDLAQVGRDFDTVVVFNPCIIPFLAGYNKLVVMNACVPADVPQVTWGLAPASSGQGQASVHASNVQYIRTSKSAEQASLDAARFCMYLFQYLRLQGVPRNSILICCKSKLMEMLLGELFAEDPQFSGPGSESKPGLPVIQEIDRFFATDYLIVSTEGGFGFHDMQEVLAKSREGVYIIGEDAKLPFNISALPLALGNGTQVRDLGQLVSLVKKCDQKAG